MKNIMPMIWKLKSSTNLKKSKTKCNLLKLDQNKIENEIALSQSTWLKTIKYLWKTLGLDSFTNQFY